MSISIYPSVVTLPIFNTHETPLVVDFLAARFPKIAKEIWRKRVEQHKVLDENCKPISLKSTCVSHSKIIYFREVDSEPVIPFKESILFQNNHILVADKPHFLPVTPCGAYVNQSLLNRLKNRTDIPELVPAHRIDRETAGVVLFSVQKKSRGLYQKLFMDGKIRKSYMALTHLPKLSSRRFIDDDSSIIRKRIVKGEPWFRMKIDETGEPNSTTRVKLLEVKDNRAILRLFPETGKKHQLRLHLSSEGYPIVNDHLYPELLPESCPDFDHPLQLLAQSLEFIDPVSGDLMEFVSSFTIGSNLSGIDSHLS